MTIRNHEKEHSARLTSFVQWWIVDSPSASYMGDQTDPIDKLVEQAAWKLNHGTAVCHRCELNNDLSLHSPARLLQARWQGTRPNMIESSLRHKLRKKIIANIFNWVQSSDIANFSRGVPRIFLRCKFQVRTLLDYLLHDFPLLMFDFFDISTYVFLFLFEFPAWLMSVSCSRVFRHTSQPGWYILIRIRVSLLHQDSWLRFQN
jgi:hypothetical protein